MVWWLHGAGRSKEVHMLLTSFSIECFLQGTDFWHETLAVGFQTTLQTSCFVLKKQTHIQHFS